MTLKGSSALPGLSDIAQVPAKKDIASIAAYNFMSGRNFIS